MVSKKRVDTGGELSRTVCLLCGSTDEVSHESNPSSAALERSRVVKESTEDCLRDDLWLPGSRRVLDDMGRTA